MAQQDNGNKMVKNIKSAEISKIIKNLNQAQKDVSTNLYGFNRDISDKNSVDFNDIKSKLRDLNDKYKETTGENVIEFFTKLAFEENRINQKKLKGGNTDFNQVVHGLSQAFSTPNNGFMAQLYVEEKERLNKYKEYEFVVKLIPQLNQIIDIIADGIISPDDYTKQIFTIKYNGATTSEVPSERNIFDNLKTIEKRYKIENKAKNIIKDTLICGDQFYTNLPLKREFQKMLTESYDPFLNETTALLNENQVILSEAEENELNKLVKSSNKHPINWRQDITKIINENVEIITKPLSIYEDELSILKESTETLTQSFTTVDMSLDGIMQGNNVNEKKVKELQNINLDGSYVKKLDPSKVVKLNVGSTCFGYYYIENDTVENIVKPASNSNLTKVVMGNNVDIAMEGVDRQDPKVALISGIVSKNISKKLDKKFLEKNKEFKRIIYELVRQEYILNKKIRIVYFSPDEVTHFRVNEKETGYGTSLIEPVLFTAKLYLATLTTTLMLKLTRSADHRTFYVETGLSKDIEETIQSVIRDIKAKEVSLKDLESIDTIFNNIGQFHDYFIPQTGGEKAIDVEVTSGQDVQLENDLLEFLLKTMVSALGVPANLLQMGEEVEFSRSLAMQNSKFLRYIISTQKEFTEPFASHYSALYKNEFSTNDENFSSEKLEVCLPSPSSLNYTNMTDQINNAQSIIDFIVQTLVGEQNNDPTKSDAIRKYVVKQYVTAIDWDTLEKDIETNLGLSVKSKLLQANDGNDDMSGDDY